MKPKTLLRIAAGLLIFHLLGHSLGVATWHQTTDPVKQEVVNQMTQHKFPFMGTDRSAGDYFYGFGYITSITLAIVAILLCIISGSLGTARDLSYKLVLALAITLFAFCIDEFIFFFPFAAVNTLLAGVLSFIAALQIKKSAP